MPLEDAEGRAGSRVPQADGVVPRAGGEGGAAVDFDCGEAGDPGAMPLEDAEGLAGSRVPEAGGVVVRAGGGGGGGGWGSGPEAGAARPSISIAARLVIPFVCPSRTRRVSPVRGSQRRMVL